MSAHAFHQATTNAHNAFPDSPRIELMFNFASGILHEFCQENFAVGSDEQGKIVSLSEYKNDYQQGTPVADLPLFVLAGQGDLRCPLLSANEQLLLDGLFAGQLPEVMIEAPTLIGILHCLLVNTNHLRQHLLGRAQSLGQQVLTDLQRRELDAGLKPRNTGLVGEDPWAWCARVGDLMQPVCNAEPTPDRATYWRHFKDHCQDVAEIIRLILRGPETADLPHIRSLCEGWGVRHNFIFFDISWYNYALKLARGLPDQLSTPVETDVAGVRVTLSNGPWAAALNEIAFEHGNKYDKNAKAPPGGLNRGELVLLEQTDIANPAFIAVRKALAESKARTRGQSTCKACGAVGHNQGGRKCPMSAHPVPRGVPRRSGPRNPFVHNADGSEAAPVESSDDDQPHQVRVSEDKAAGTGMGFRVVGRTSLQNFAGWSCRLLTFGVSGSNWNLNDVIGPWPQKLLNKVGHHYPLHPELLLVTYAANKPTNPSLSARPKLTISFGSLPRGRRQLLVHLTGGLMKSMC